MHRREHRCSRGRSLAARSRAVSLLLIALLAAVTAIPLAAVWQAFGPKPAAPDFNLVDQNARPFRLSAQRGHSIVLFFGCTHCPDACPTTLAHLAQAVRVPGVARDIRVAFITVDPARDSPRALRHYVQLFDPRLGGLTGSATAQAVPAQQERGDYFMTHGTTIYYLGRDGTFKGYGHWDDEVSALVRSLKTYQ